MGGTRHSADEVRSPLDIADLVPYNYDQEMPNQKDRNMNNPRCKTERFTAFLEGMDVNTQGACIWRSGLQQQPRTLLLDHREPDKDCVYSSILPPLPLTQKHSGRRVSPPQS